MKKTHTLNDSTHASNPGNVTLKPIVWIKHNPKVGLMALSGLIICILLTYCFFFMIVPIIIIGFFLFPRIRFYWIRQKEHFEYGDSNGGIVISDNPPLVAVTTDLTKGFGEFPVIKIIKYKGKGKVGDKIGTIALYSASVGETLPHWVDFHPVPIEYATNNSEEIGRALKSYDENQWIQIQDRLKQVPKPFKEGLFKVDVKDSDWRRPEQFTPFI